MAISQLDAAEYEKAVKSIKGIIPIEQSPSWREFDEKISQRKPLGLFAYRKPSSHIPIALFSATQYEQPRYKLVWIKHGPLWIDKPSASEIKQFIKELKSFISQIAPEATFVRLNLPSGINTGLPRSMHSVMYDHTVIIDLTKSEDERLADMTQSGRRALRKAWKASLNTKEVPQVSGSDFTKLYAILEETASRDNFGIHPRKLYLAMLSALGKNARLFVISHKNQPLAWAIVTTYNKNAVYYYGASSRKARELNAPYQLHWDIMKKLKEESIKTYDFMGIASPNNPHLKNVSVFKEKFSRETVEVAPSYDLVMKPTRYKMLDFMRKTQRKVRFL